MQEYNESMFLDIINNKKVSFSDNELKELADMVSRPGFLVLLKIIDKAIVDNAISAVFNKDEGIESEAKNLAVALHVIKTSTKSLANNFKKKGDSRKLK